MASAMTRPTRPLEKLPEVKQASLAITKMFDEFERQSLDDADFAPLVRSVVEATREYLVAQGLPPEDAVTASTEVLNVALERYVEICKKNDPEGTDVETDAEVFKYLMERGHWPSACDWRAR